MVTALLLLLLGSADAAPQDVLPAVCSADADCVPKTCCHADACVPQAQAPTCKGKLCTKDCKPGTVDCGGRCACEAGQCMVKHKPPKVPSPPTPPGPPRAPPEPKPPAQPDPPPGPAPTPPPGTPSDVSSGTF